MSGELTNPDFMLDRYMDDKPMMTEELKCLFEKERFGIRRNFIRDGFISSNEYP